MFLYFILFLLKLKLASKNEHVQNRQIHRDRKEVDGCQGLERGEKWRVTTNGSQISFRGDEMFWN